MMYDLAIVGGGVAGLYLATLLKGKNVLLIEEHKNLGPTRCSGIVSKRIKKFLDLPKTLIEREVNKAILCCGNFGVEIKLDSYVLNKDKFEQYLLKKASKNVEIKFERVNKIDQEDSCVAIFTKDKCYETKHIVGCDGPNSIVRRSFLDEEPKKFFFGKFCYSREKFSDYYAVFFDSKYSDLFSWIAPRKGKVEYGVICEKKLNKYYETFISEKKPKNVEGEFFGVIPTGLCRCSFRRGILIGNSAGMTKPLTGGGIIYSLRAAEIASEELNKEKPNFKEYEKKCRREFGREIKYQLLARKIYSKLSEKRKQKLMRTIAKTNIKLDMDFPMTDILKNKKLKFFKNFLFG